MPSVEVRSIENRKVGEVELDESVFASPVKTHLMHAEVRRQLAKRRSGTHSTRNRALVSGGGAKPWRQKGTGRARQGTTRAPQWEGGGAVFGPVPRSYEHALPKKMRAGALRSALSLRLREGALTVVDAIELAEYKTRRMAEILGKLGLGGDRVLLVLEGADVHVERSGRNLPRVTVLRAEGLNVYDVLRHQKVVLTQKAVDRIVARLGRKAAEDRA